MDLEAVGEAAVMKMINEEIGSDALDAWDTFEEDPTITRAREAMRNAMM